MTKRGRDIVFVRPKAGPDLFYQGFSDMGYAVIPPYRGNGFLPRAFREVFMRFSLPGREAWYNQDVLIGAPVIIVFDPTITVEYIRWLRRNNPNSRIIVYYTNPVELSRLSPELIEGLCEAWSSDPVDCDSHLSLHRMSKGFYFDWMRMPKHVPEYDVCYVGREKGRRETLENLDRAFTERGLSLFSYIVADHRYESRFKPRCQPSIPYSRVLDLAGRARAILSLSLNAQQGVTLRVYESLFNEMKLVTDNRRLEAYEFYHPDNIFILGKDDLDDLPAFLEKPYRPVDAGLLSSYGVEEWLPRLLDGCC